MNESICISRHDRLEKIACFGTKKSVKHMIIIYTFVLFFRQYFYATNTVLTLYIRIQMDKDKKYKLLVVLFVVAHNFMVTSKTDINLFKENIIIIQHTCQSIHIYIWMDGCACTLCVCKCVSSRTTLYHVVDIDPGMYVLCMSHNM